MATTDELHALAQKTADDFNRNHGGYYLQTAERLPEKLTINELRAQAETQPGEYVAAGIFMAIKGRRPSRGEAVRLGHMLGQLAVARRKSGPYTLWLLDKAFAQRTH